MNRPVSDRLTVLLAAAAAGGLLWFAGCQNAPPTDPQAGSSSASSGDGASGRAGRAAEAEAKRLAEAMARSNAAGEAQMPEAEVLWIEPRDETAGGQASHVAGAQADAAAAPTPSLIPAAEPPAEQAPPSAGQSQTRQTQAEAEPPATRRPAPGDLAALDRDALLDALLARVRRGQGTPLQKALDEALLTAADPGRPLDPAAMTPLDEAQREQVAQFQSMIQLFRHQLTSASADSGGGVDRRAVEMALDDLFGSMPLTIRTAELCRRVEGFGVYEPFESRTFMAGRDNKMIIYLELEHFTPVEIGNGLHEVRLSQDVALYTDWDGQKVWRHETQQIVDRSRNQRRDFFVVQMITLPARLNVGKYILKVDVTDQHGGSVDGVPIEINLVADQALVREDTTPDEDRAQLIRKLLEEDDDQPLMGK